MTNAQLLDQFRQRHGLQSDYALAKLLDVSVQVVSNFRQRGTTETLLAKMLAHDLEHGGQGAKPTR